MDRFQHSPKLIMLYTLSFTTFYYHLTLAAYDINPHFALVRYLQDKSLGVHLDLQDVEA